MIDREKVIKGLKCCADWQRGSMHRFCEVCPYNDNPVMRTCNNLFPLFRDALALLKADQAQLTDLRKRLETIADDANLYDECITESAVRKLIDEMRGIALRGVPEEHYERDCRDCVEWETCPVGKGAHERGASIGYSAGECPDFMRLTVADEK